MENLEILVTQEQGSITTNFEELKKSLELQMSAYKDFVVTEDELNVAKGDLAFLRKFRTSMEDKRKEVKKSYMTPYTDFETSYKELLAIVDEPINTIDQQLKLFEADRIEKKKERVTELYEQEMGEYLRFLPIEKNYNEKWNNKSYLDNDILYDISEMRLKVKKDLEVIKSLNSEIEDDVIDAYEKSGNDLAAAIARNTQYVNDKAKIEAAKPESPVQKLEELGEKLNQLDTLVNKVKVVHFVVSKEDADQVRELLEFSNITFSEE